MIIFMNETKREMKLRARLMKGLVNALKSDVDYICADVNNFDVICMSESLREARDTTQRMVDSITELEYLLYLLKNDESC